MLPDEDEEETREDEVLGFLGTWVIVGTEWDRTWLEVSWSVGESGTVTTVGSSLVTIACIISSFKTSFSWKALSSSSGLFWSSCATKLASTFSTTATSLSPLEIVEEDEESAKKLEDVVECILGLLASSSSKESSSFSRSLSSYLVFDSEGSCLANAENEERYSLIFSSYCLTSCSFLSSSSLSCIRILCRESIWLINAVTWHCNFWLIDLASFSASSSSKTCSVKSSFSSWRVCSWNFKLVFSSLTFSKEFSTSRRSNNALLEAEILGSKSLLDDDGDCNTTDSSPDVICLLSGWVLLLYAKSGIAEVLFSPSCEQHEVICEEVESEGEAWLQSSHEESFFVDVNGETRGFDSFFPLSSSSSSVWVAQSMKSESLPSSEDEEEGQEGEEWIPDSEWGIIRWRQHLLLLPQEGPDEDGVVAGEWLEVEEWLSSSSDSWSDEETDRVDVVLTSKSANPSSSEDAWWGRLCCCCWLWSSLDSLAEETMEPIVIPREDSTSSVRRVSCSFSCWLRSWWLSLFSCSINRDSSSLRETTSIWSFIFSSMRSLSRDSKESSCERRETHSCLRHWVRQEMFLLSLLSWNEETGLVLLLLWSPWPSSVRLINSGVTPAASKVLLFFSMTWTQKIKQEER